ncbi:MAG: single-stranded DNA-binding protein [Bacillota bacterium]|jgi:single-strand DNA-binding protein
MLNRIVVIGRLTRDPELRSTSNGVAVATFTVAVDRNFSNNRGERETDFIPVVVWRGLAETCGRYLSKGRLVGVEGRLQIRNYEANDGSRRTIAEIVADNVQFLSPKDSTGSGGGSGYTPDSDFDREEMTPLDEIPF